MKFDGACNQERKMDKMRKVAPRMHNIADIPWEGVKTRIKEISPGSSRDFSTMVIPEKKEQRVPYGSKVWVTSALNEIESSTLRMKILKRKYKIVNIANGASLLRAGNWIGLVFG